MQSNHRRRCLTGDIEAFLGSKLSDLFAMFEDVEKSVLGVVVRIALLGEALADELVGPDGGGVAVVHLLLVRLVEGSTGDADEEHDDTEVDQIAAVTAGVAP